MTGEIDFRPSYEQKNNRTEVTLTLAPNESVFIVYPTEKNCFGDEKSLQKQQKEGSYSAKEFSEVAVELGEYTRQTGNNCLSEFGKGLQPGNCPRERCGLWNNLDCSLPD